MTNAIGRLVVVFVRTAMLVAAVLGLATYAAETKPVDRKLSELVIPFVLLYGREGFRWEGKI